MEVVAEVKPSEVSRGLCRRISEGAEYWYLELALLVAACSYVKGFFRHPETLTMVSSLTPWRMPHQLFHRS